MQRPPGNGPEVVPVLAEFGDATNRYTDAQARRNYAGTSPITRASGKKTLVLSRYARNKRLADALFQQAFSALTASPAPTPSTTVSGPATSATTTPSAGCLTAS